MMPVTKCKSHKSLLGCPLPDAHFGCSGLPCTDMSAAGLRQKKEGPTNAVYMSHGRFVEARRVPLFVLECTPVLWLAI